MMWRRRGREDLLLLLLLALPLWLLLLSLPARERVMRQSGSGRVASGKEPEEQRRTWMLWGRRIWSQVWIRWRVWRMPAVLWVEKEAQVGGGSTGGRQERESQPDDS